MSDKTTFEIENAGKSAGLQVWRIENFQLVSQPSSQRGNFFTGDSYILLNSIQLKGTNFRYDLHFWLGDKSSQDERGTAAILSIKIDDQLGGKPVQYREIQGFESNTFMGYFKNGIKYCKGGVSSGFTHAKTNVSEIRRVLQIKGRRNVRALEVDMNWSSFNQGDCFIIEIDNNIYQWNGSQCNRMEKLKACQVVNMIKNEEKAGKGKVHIIEEGEKMPQEVLKVLKGTPSDVKPAIADDDSKSRTKSKSASLFQVSSDSGTLEVTNLGSSPFKQSCLDSGDCFIVDTGSGQTIFVWKGSKASKDERSGALNTAMKFIKKNNYLPQTKIQVISQHSEPALFTQYFKDWRKKNQTVGFGTTWNKSKIAKIEKVKFDMKSLHDTPKLAAKHRMVDDGSGKVEVWRVEGSEKVAVKKEDYGKFFAGDSYIILYTYICRNKEEYIIYFWQGKQSTIDEITASAYLATQLDDEYGQKPVQVRVVMGKEPMHFLSIFPNPIIISRGGYSRALKKETGLSAIALYQVRSSELGGTKAIEVASKACSLNSNDAFVLKTADKCFIWEGIGASEIETKAAEIVAKETTTSKPILLKENGESEEFWNILGGKADYANDPRLFEDLDDNPARLFAISNAKGNVCVEEIAGEFTQTDLEVDDVMMLDTWKEVYLWIGNGANQEERREAPKLAAEYIRDDPRGRDQDCVVIMVKMDHEPVTFKGYFPSWDDSYFTKNLNYEDRIKHLQI